MNEKELEEEHQRYLEEAHLILFQVAYVFLNTPMSELCLYVPQDYNIIEDWNLEVIKEYPVHQPTVCRKGTKPLILKDTYKPVDK